MLNFLPRHHHEEQSTRLKHAFDDILTAQRGTAEESQGVQAAATRDLKEIRAESGRIRARTYAQSEKARPGQTSEARSLVEDMLQSMERARRGHRTVIYNDDRPEHIRGAIWLTILILAIGYGVINAFVPSSDMNNAVGVLQASAATMVVYIYGRDAWAALRTKNPKRTDFLIVDIVLAWLSTDGMTILAVLFRLAGMPQWFVNSEIYAPIRLLWWSRPCSTSARRARSTAWCRAATGWRWALASAALFCWCWCCSGAARTSGL